MSSRPLVYVAGPITGDPWGCVRTATHVAAALDRAGAHAYLPQLSVLHEMIHPQPYEHWIEHGLAMVERCDGLYRLAGDSPGADREVAHAMTLGIPCYIEAPLPELEPGVHRLDHPDDRQGPPLSAWVESIRVAEFRPRALASPTVIAAGRTWSDPATYSATATPEETR